MQKQATYKVLDYAPFGMQMPARSFIGASGYKFGFNGMLRESDIAEGNYTTPFRELDTRLGGRWWSQDPIVKPWESPYAGFSNNPIVFSDPSGLNPKDDKVYNGGDVEPVVVTAKRNPKPKEDKEESSTTNPSAESTKSPTTTPSDNLKNKIQAPPELSRAQKIENYHNYISNRLINDYDFASKVITLTMMQNREAGQELFNEIVRARTGQIAKPMFDVFFTGITIATPIPGDEAIAMMVSATTNRALGTSILIIERYIPSSTMRLLTDPVQKTIIKSPGLLKGERYVTGIMFKNKYRFQFQKGKFHGGNLLPHVNLSNGSSKGIHIFTTKEGISKWGLLGTKL